MLIFVLVVTAVVGRWEAHHARHEDYAINHHARHADYAINGIDMEMSPAEVSALLGPPKSRAERPGGFSWSWGFRTSASFHDDSRDVNLQFVDGTELEHGTSRIRVGDGARVAWAVLGRPDASEQGAMIFSRAPLSIVVLLHDDRITRLGLSRLRY
jgi:hypothetical protein